jgi:hypothetical protein
VGFTHAKPDSKWTYGGRAKLLKGVANVQTKKSEIQIEVDEGDLYNYNANVNMEVNVGVGVDGDTYKTLEDISEIEINSFEDFLEVAELNNGFGIDLGANMQFSEKLSFGASLLNVGFINWKNFAQNYTVNANLKFDGVVIDEIDLDGNLDSLINHQLDSIFQSYEDEIKDGTDTTYNSYTDWLPAQLFLSAHYQVSPKLRASASLYTEFYKGISMGTVLGLNYRMGRTFNVTTTWWWYNKSATNLGLGLVFKPWFGQLYLVMDNILPSSFVRIDDTELGLESVLLPYQAKNFNARIGINLVFGKIKDDSRLPQPGLNKRKHGVRKWLYRPTDN